MGLQGQKTGFGAIALTALAPGSDYLQHTINAATGSRVGITHISFSAFQTSGGASADTELVIPFYVVRGSIGGTPPIPLPASNPFVIPTTKQIADSGYELMDNGLYRLTNACLPITYERGHLECTGNQQLIVISCALLDGTTTTPVELGSTNSQTVLGYDASQNLDIKLR